MSLKFASCMTLVWLTFLAWAIWDYPKPDNLAISWPVLIVWGVNGLARLSPAVSIVLAALETVVIFFGSALIGWFVEQLFTANIPYSKSNQ